MGQDAGGCLVGSNFVHCLGPPAHALFCSPGKTGSCRWISTGKAVLGFTQPVQPTCGTNTSWWPLGRFLFEYGDQPWLRTRAMTLSVKEDASLKATQNEVKCSSCAIPWASSADTLCNRTAHVATEAMPGTYILRMTPPGGLYGWLLELEVDTQASPPAARLCRLAWTDSLMCSVAKSVVCADSGSVTLTTLPTATTYKSIKGSFTAKFGQDQVSGTFAGKAAPSSKVPSCKP